MDLHQSCRILSIPSTGKVVLDDLEVAREASPIRELMISTDSVAASELIENLRIETIVWKGGVHGEFTIPAWSASVLVVHDGFCLTGTDGESPDAHAGQVVVYRRRNRNSAIILAAGPNGFRATLIIAPMIAQVTL